MRKWLKEIREKLGLPAEEVAVKAGISRTMYYYIETGERGAKLPVTTAKKIAAALGFDWQRFYDDAANG